MTPYRCSCPVDGFSWLAALVPERPDALITPPLPGVAAGGLVGLWPRAEWRLGRDGGLGELKRFCRATPGPAVGFLSYHAGFAPLGLRLPVPDFPAGVFRKYRVLLAPSPDARLVHIHAEDPALAREAAEILRPRPTAADLPGFRGTVRASLDRRAYQEAVRQGLTRILDGDVYQLNLSIRFDTDWPERLEPVRLFARLLEAKPAMFYGLYHDMPYVILSTSPERFLQVRSGRVLGQPIKGTCQAGPGLSGRMGALLASPKEDAELSMIVDLIRNDVSPHCEYGSVGVSGHKSVFEVDGLLQMYSNVTARLRPGSSALDLLWDALPPGSVTGCPKKRAVEVIAELEPHHREAYCGCLAVVHGREDLDSSVAIRTAIVDESRGNFGFFAGSGIVVDSDPRLEYEETLVKTAKFLALTRRARP